jgi:hypothetical protein
MEHFYCAYWFEYVEHSLALKEEHRLSSLHNKVLKGICESKAEEVAEGWRRLDNDDCIFCTFQNILLKLIK